jgi:hypothetical protein
VWFECRASRACSRARGRECPRRVRRTPAVAGLRRCQESGVGLADGRAPCTARSLRPSGPCSSQPSVKLSCVEAVSSWRVATDAAAPAEIDRLRLERPNGVRAQLSRPRAVHPTRGPSLFNRRVLRKPGLASWRTRRQRTPNAHHAITSIWPTRRTPRRAGNPSKLAIVLFKSGLGPLLPEFLRVSCTCVLIAPGRTQPRSDGTNVREFSCCR